MATRYVEFDLFYESEDQDTINTIVSNLNTALTALPSPWDISNSPNVYFKNTDATITDDDVCQEFIKALQGAYISGKGIAINIMYYTNVFNFNY